MSQRFLIGTSVVFSNPTEQSAHEEENPTPYTIETSEMKDLYNSGLPEDCWDQVVSIKDANGEIFIDHVDAMDLESSYVQN